MRPTRDQKYEFKETKITNTTITEGGESSQFQIQMNKPSEMEYNILTGKTHNTVAMIQAF